MDKDLDFKITLLKYFWNNRERERIPTPSGIMKQKYLFFYNIFAKINDKKYTFDNLKAFKNGPIYYDIYVKAKEKIYLEQLNSPNQAIDKEIAETTLTLMYLYRSKLSCITHTFDLWNKNYNEYPGKEISENDITSEDLFKVQMLYEETRNVKDNYEIYYNKYDIPMLFEKGIKNRIVNNYYSELQFNTEDKCPIYVSEQDGELYFD